MSDFESPDPDDRLQAWKDFRRDSIQKQLPINPERLSLATNSLYHEEDDKVHRFGTAVLIDILTQRVFQDPHARCADLGQWLWEPCLQQSLSLSIVDPKHVRDEDAVFNISRHLSFKDFAENKFLRVHKGFVAWGDLLSQPFKAICIVGRLGLFGDWALEHWSKKGLRYRFIADQRPPDLARGQIDVKRYHTICERVWSGGKHKYVRRFQVKEENGQRIDYGLVQRYWVSYSGKRVIVILCAGLTGLGTVGAAKWAAETLVGHDGEPLPLPEKTSYESTLEAVIEVTAASAPHPTRWQPTDVKPVSVLVDKQVWCNEHRQWQRSAPDTITMCRDRRNNIKILFDGEPSHFFRYKQIFRLIVKLCELAAKKRNQTVRIASLAGDADLWKNHVNDIEYVRGRLRELKTRRLGDALTIGPDSVTVRSQICFEDLD